MGFPQRGIVFGVTCNPLGARTEPRVLGSKPKVGQEELEEISEELQQQGEIASPQENRELEVEGRVDEAFRWVPNWGGGHAG